MAQLTINGTRQCFSSIILMTLALRMKLKQIENMWNEINIKKRLEPKMKLESNIKDEKYAFALYNGPICQNATI